MALPPGLPPEEAFSSESLLCVLTAATIPCSSRLPGQTHLRAYQHHCLKRPSVQMQSIRKIRPPSTIFISPCDRNDRTGSANSDRGISGGSFRRQPKMAEMRRAYEQTSASEPHSDL